MILRLKNNRGFFIWNGEKCILVCLVLGKLGGGEMQICMTELKEELYTFRYTTGNKWHSSLCYSFPVHVTTPFGSCQFIAMETW